MLHPLKVEVKMADSNDDATTAVSSIDVASNQLEGGAPNALSTNSSISDSDVKMEEASREGVKVEELILLERERAAEELLV